ncbi:hypothetical protein H6G76_27455 [Nostoc sp. FACHB-152]|nr:hypothetical protein [Nostoc sp. FACHB-152]MBD2450798.1 hypothetical protein [Nostoc sp. FACHB-152]
MLDKSQPNSYLFDDIIASYPSESLVVMETLTKKLLRLKSTSILIYSDNPLEEQNFMSLFNNMRVMTESKPFNCVASPIRRSDCRRKGHKERDW